jgi:hypothetical protein
MIDGDNLFKATLGHYQALAPPVMGINWGQMPK